MAELPVLVHEVVTRELAAADLAGIVLYVQIQQSDLPSASARGILLRPVINAIPAASVVAVAAAAAGRLVDPRRQQVPLGMLPVAVLRLEGVLAIAASIATAVIAVVATVIARVDAWAACVAAFSRRRSTVLVVLARWILAICQLAIPRRTSRCTVRCTVSMRRRRRIILIQNTVEAYRSIAARDVVHHGKDCARGSGLFRARDSGSATR